MILTSQQKQKLVEKITAILLNYYFRSTADRFKTEIADGNLAKCDSLDEIINYVKQDIRSNKRDASVSAAKYAEDLLEDLQDVYNEFKALDSDIKHMEIVELQKQILENLKQAAPVAGLPISHRYFK